MLNFHQLSTLNFHTTPARNATYIDILKQKKVNLNFYILSEMQDWDVNYGKMCLPMDECQMYRLHGKIISHLQHSSTLC